MKVVFVGRGKVGTALYRSALEASLDATLARGSAPDRSSLDGADLVVLAVPDAAIGKVGAEIARRVEGPVLVHCAGARGPGALAEARARGASVGAMHPLVSFANAEHPPPLSGALFLVDGDARAVALARILAVALGARPVERAAHGPAYHAAAALAANGAAALAFHSIRILGRLGISRDDAREGVAALLASVAANVRTLGVPAALTGPIVRGDADTVRAHRSAIAAHPAAKAAYDCVGEAVLACARAAGLPKRPADEVRTALKWNARDVRPARARRGGPTRSEPRRPRRGS